MYGSDEPVGWLSNSGQVAQRVGSSAILRFSSNQIIKIPINTGFPILVNDKIRMFAEEPKGAGIIKAPETDPSNTELVVQKQKMPRHS